MALRRGGSGRADITVVRRRQKRLEKGVTSHHQELTKDGLVDVMNPLLLLGRSSEVSRWNPEAIECMVGGDLFADGKL